MRYFILLLATALTLLAADPQQPKVGSTQVINATNGYAGNLTVRTQFNVGYPGQAGLVVLNSISNLSMTLGASSSLASNTFITFPDGFNGLVKATSTVNGGSNSVTLAAATAIDQLGATLDVGKHQLYRSQLRFTHKRCLRHTHAPPTQPTASIS
jgi:hypothetical protein